MSYRLRQILPLALILFVSIAHPVMAQEPRLSANIPLDSYIYTVLDKLSGLGYIDPLPTGTRPYRRMQAAKWVLAAKSTLSNETNPPVYVREMVDRLWTDLRDEIAVIEESGKIPSLALQELAFAGTFYDGPSLSQHRTLSHYQPLNLYNNGYVLEQDFNTAFSAVFESSLHPRLLISADPRLFYNKDDDFEIAMNSGYIKTTLWNIELQAGKDAMAWGQGQHGNLILTNNSSPKIGFKLSNLEPIVFDGWFKLLRQMNATFFYTELAGDRIDVKDPSFVGYRMDFAPTPDFTFALSFSSIVGGDGRELGWDDLGDFFQGDNRSGLNDQWNSIAGFDLRWRIPKLKNIQIYAEYFGEDQASHPIPHPIKAAQTLGIYLPQLASDGSWDLLFEAARTNAVWYQHHAYTDGYVDDGNIMGDAMGCNARRFYTRVTHYFDSGSQLMLHGEYVTLDKAALSPQNVTSVWVSYKRMVGDDWWLDASVGMAWIDNFNYQADRSEQNYILGIELRRFF